MSVGGVAALSRTLRRTAVLSLRTFFGRSRLTGEADVVVSLTTYGPRTRWAHLAISSIAAGSVRPGRIVLWLDREQYESPLPLSLRRLARRGLEIKLAEDLGPHKKWYGHVMSPDRREVPLVTADDDMMYPSSWLRALLDEHRSKATVVVAHRARRLVGSGAQLAPYASWPLAPVGSTSFANFATGVGGVLYPPRLLDRLAEQGRAFVHCAPRADDIWLHATGFRSGFPTRRVSTAAGERFIPVRGARSGGLLDANVAGGGNDEQIVKTYSVDERRALSRAASAAPEERH